MKILIFTKNWLGDLLFQFPAIEAISERYPTAEIVCAAPGRCHPILKAHPAIRRVIGFDEKKEHRGFFKKLAFVRAIRLEGFDQAYLFHRSRTRALICKLAGIRERMGFGKGRSGLLTHAVREPLGRVHQVDYFLHLLSELGFSIYGQAAYRFYSTERARERADELLSRNKLLPQHFVCFHLGANWAPKRWPIAFFAELADRIWDRWQVPVAVTGAHEDLELVNQMRPRTQRARLLSMVGQTDLEELGAVFSRALCVVTGDSGPMHIASGAGTPVLAIFGPTDPALTGPRGVGEKKIVAYVPEGYEVPWYGKNLPKEGWLAGLKPPVVFQALEESGWMKKTGVPEKKFVGPAVAEEKNRKPLKKSPRVLFVTLSNIGDVVMTLPVLMSLVARYPEAERTVVCGPRAAGILEGSRFVDRLVVYDKRASWWGQLRFLGVIRDRCYDLVIDLRHTLIPYLISARRRSPLLRRSSKISKMERHLEILERMGLAVEKIPAFDFFTAEEENRMLEALKKEKASLAGGILAVAPASASTLKTWKLDGFRRLIRELLAHYPQTVLLCGDERERVLAEPLVEIDPRRVINFAGRLTLRQTAALLARADLVVANDSAIMHLAYQLGRPTVALFGPTDPFEYGYEAPHVRNLRESLPCVPCRLPRCRFERQHCFEDLGPEKVYRACKELLDARLAPTATSA
ncbi:MAG: lipopolysaccharide heptosyltransferase II [Candidatus Omnitrophota bacterium]